MIEQDRLAELTAQIAAAHVSRNAVQVDDVPGLIAGIAGALASIGEPAPEAKPAPVTNWRRTVKPDGITSLIDGKPYKMLKRHLSTHGLTPDEYRARYGLPADYPMTAANYSARRAELAKELGLGRTAHKRRTTRGGARAAH